MPKKDKKTPSKEKVASVAKSQRKVMEMLGFNIRKIRGNQVSWRRFDFHVLMASDLNLTLPDAVDILLRRASISVQDHVLGDVVAVFRTYTGNQLLTAFSETSSKMRLRQQLED